VRLLPDLEFMEVFHGPTLARLPSVRCPMIWL
jgi:hypothetical protein